MRAVAIDAHGGLEQVRLRTDWPEPSAGPGQAVVEVKACGLNYLDIFVLHGMPGLPVEMPRIPGGDISGVVHSVGAGVGREWVGRRVLVDPHIKHGGALGEHVMNMTDVFTFPSGCHVAEVEVDAETGAVALVRYTVVDDYGRLINPLIVEGQLHGAVALGIGSALLEEVAYDEAGQLLAGSYMDYLLPTATDVPTMAIDHLETLSPLNPLGLKGVGESGALPVPAVLASAIEDALGPDGGRVIRMPLGPARLMELLPPSAEGAPGLP